ncbi:MAG: hypothetical protein LBR57_03175 [Alistipes sp.]|jgi:hypothetical protein|nr:hypothetical protein [Alistipes sp.]
MKRAVKYLFCATLVSLLAACAPGEPKKPGLGSPANFDATDFRAVISSDPKMPYRVYLEASVPGVVPIWDRDGKNTIDAYYDAVLAGTYTINVVGVYNRGGITMGSTPKPVTFTIERGLADIYLTTGPWVWDSATSPHFGNSPPNGAGPGQGGWGSTAPDPAITADLYDDVLMFETDGTFTLDTGPGGKVWVNEEATNLPEWGPPSTSAVLRNFVQLSNSGWRWSIAPATPYPLLSFGGGFPSYVPSDSYATDVYEIRLLDDKTLYLRVLYEWGAFWMRFTHPPEPAK